MLPRIFNDVIGPVMRGPSSSHTAASWRIAKICLQLLQEPLKKAVIEFDKDGAWAKNYLEQGTVMGINGGLLNLEITDSQFKKTDQLLEKSGLQVYYQVGSFETKHVNTIRMTLEGQQGNSICIMAASLGGGSFQIYQIDNFNVDICGDYYELILKVNQSDFDVKNIKSIIPSNTSVYQSSSWNQTLFNIKFSHKIPDQVMGSISKLSKLQEVITLNPILPIISGNQTKLPFTNIDSLIDYAKKENKNLGEMGLMYEKYLSGLSATALKAKMNKIVQIIENSIKTGLKGTVYEDRILHQQSHLVAEAEKKGKILPDSIMNKIIARVTAIMEAKSSMEVFVANPTAGSCGAIGGAVSAIAEKIKASENELIEAYFAAGIVGAYFAAGPGFSAEAHGCQVECGASSGMAAAAIAQLLGASAKQSIDAASMAIQNMIGLICDPVADRVEVPCLGKNINAAVNAYASATMVCSGYDAVIPLNEVIHTVAQVGNQMPSCIKCTGTGGLAITKTALDIKENLKRP
jgi:L-serine dehydratase